MLRISLRFVLAGAMAFHVPYRARSLPLYAAYRSHFTLKAMILRLTVIISRLTIIHFTFDFDL